MAKTKPPTKTRNPQDATRRNVQASAKRDAALDKRLDRVEDGIRLAQLHIQRLAKAGLPDADLALIELEIAKWRAD